MKNLTRQNPRQLFVAQELINKVKSKCCGIKDHHIFGEKAPKGSITHPGKDGDTGGYQKLKSEDAIGVMCVNRGQTPFMNRYECL